jgi:hypothetical protein
MCTIPPTTSGAEWHPPPLRKKMKVTATGNVWLLSWQLHPTPSSVLVNVTSRDNIYRGTY